MTSSFQMIAEFLKAHPLIMVVMLCGVFACGGYFVGVEKANVRHQTETQVDSSERIRKDDLERFLNNIREHSATRATQNDRTTTTEETRPDGTKTRIVVLDRSKIQTQVVTKTQVQVVEKLKTVYVDRVVHATQAEATTPAMSRYSIGAKAYKNKLTSLKPDDYSVDIGYRVYSEIWLKGSYQIKSHAVGVGLAWHF